MSKVCLYTITGLPYSGKTTLVKKMLQHLDCEVVSIDDIMNEKNMWRKGHPTLDDWNIAYSEAYEKLKNFLKKGRSVIFDGGSLKFHERQTQKKIADEYGVNTILIYINIAKEEIKRRRLRNVETKERGHLEDKEMETAFNMFEEPTSKEQPIVYDGTTDSESFVKLLSE